MKKIKDTKPFYLFISFLVFIIGVMGLHNVDNCHNLNKINLENNLNYVETNVFGNYIYPDECYRTGMTLIFISLVWLIAIKIIEMFEVKQKIV